MLRHVQVEEKSGDAIPFPRSMRRLPAEDYTTQLPLPLDTSRDLYLLAMDDLDGPRFLQIIEDVKPKIIHDVRHFRRFDLLGTRAEQIRAVICRCGAVYAYHGLPIRTLNEQHLRCSLWDLCEGTMEVADITSGGLTGPLLILVHSNQHCRLLERYMVAAAERRSGGPWRLLQAHTKDR